MIHLATVVGTRANLLPHLFTHYRAMGVESLLVGVHLERHDSPFLPDVTAVCRAYGARIAAVYVGPWFQGINPFIYRQIQRERPDDWYLLADNDEFQVYPEPIASFLPAIEAQGYDYVEGCLIDRLARDGALPEIVPDRSLWPQFPLAGLVTHFIVHGNILKIVAAKGSVRIGFGQHAALDGHGCPPRRAYIPVHHFKWSRAVTDELRERRAFYQSVGDRLWAESDRLLQHLDAHDGRIDVGDARLWLADCKSGPYPRWNELRDAVWTRAVEFGVRLPDESPT